MEIENVVFTAASDGNLYRLKAFLDHKSKTEIAALVSSLTNGATPLLMACKNGRLDVVHYLIEDCCADIEQVGSVTFDGETIEGVTPLWCAAAAGHIDVIKYLVKNKAFVNSTTETNSTPLRAACYDGHFEIAKYLIQHGADIEIANRHGHTCLMIACYKGHYELAKYLVELGADVNRKSRKDNTALHDSAESGSLETVKLLLEHGAKFIYDSSGLSPLLSAAVNGHTEIVQYFCNEFNCSLLEKVNALELLGSTAVDKKRNMVLAVDCWQLAMRFRLDDPDNLLEKPIIQSPIASYIGASEFRTLSQLINLVDPDEIRMQALIIRERVLGPDHADTLHYIRYRGAAYADNGNFDRCILLWMYALEVQQKAEEPLSPKTYSSLQAFTELFSYMMTRGYPVVPFPDILRVFERALKEIEIATAFSEKQGQDLKDCDQFHRTLIITMYLVGLMCRLKPHLNKSEELDLKKIVYQLVRMDPRGKNGWTPLHLACFTDMPSLGRFPILSFASPEVVDLLLEVGAHPNSVDVNNNTPLHVSAMNKPFPQAVFKSLLKYGAHIDVCNQEKQTPLQLAQDAPLLDIYPLQYISLQCLCAQAIRTHNISYKGFVLKTLEPFLEEH